MQKVKANKIANSKKSVVVTDNDFHKKTIEDKSNQTQGFSKKRIILLIVFAIIAIVVVYLTIKFVLNIDFNRLFTSIHHGIARKSGILWICLLFFFSFTCVFSKFNIVWLRLRKLGYKIPLYEYWLLGFSTCFFGAVTPTIMGDSFTLIWMKSNGVPTYRVTSILFSNTLFWQAIQLFVTLPSFILVVVNRAALLSTPQGITAFVFLCAGVVIDTLSTIFMFLLCWSRRTHYFLSKVFNWIKKKLHMKYHTKAEIAEKYKAKAVIRQDFIDYCKDWKTTLLIIVLLLVNELIYYAAVGWAMYFVQYVHYGNIVYKVSFDFEWAFNSANVTMTANRLNFLIPNGEGSLEFLLKTFVQSFSTWKFRPSWQFAPILNSSTGVISSTQEILITSVTDNSILIWRLFGAILPAFFGIFSLAYWVIRKAINVKHGQKFIKEEK